MKDIDRDILAILIDLQLEKCFDYVEIRRNILNNFDRFYQIKTFNEKDFDDKIKEIQELKETTGITITINTDSSSCYILTEFNNKNPFK